MTHVLNQLADTTIDHVRYRQYVNPELADLLRSVKLDKVFVSGDGTQLRDATGREYLDFISGYGSVPFGHNPHSIWDAVSAHRKRNEPGIVQPAILVAAAQLAERLINLAPAGLERVCFTNSGAEAIEVAIKACRVATGRMGIVTAARGFHGKTLGALSATGAPKYQRGFGAPAPGFTVIPYGDTDALEAVLRAQPDEIAAVILEPIQGEGGIIVPPPGYLVAVREITARHGTLLVLDEVQTGLGRTGIMFACAESGVQPDCLTVAKALGGGIVAVGACLLAASAWSDDLALRHSSTFAGNALACRIGLASLDILEADGGQVLQNVRARGVQLRAVHERLRARFPNVVAQARGQGLLQGIAFDVHRGSYPSEWGSYLGVFGEQGQIVPLLASYLLNVEGIRTAPTLNGSDVLRIEPPLTVSEAECNVYAASIERTVELLAQGQTGALAAHLIDTLPKVIPSRQQRFTIHRNAEPDLSLDEGRFAFIVHPLGAKDIIAFDESLKTIEPTDLLHLGESLSDAMKPFLIGSTRVETKAGNSAYGEFICVARTPRDLQRLSAAEAQAVVGEAVDLARDRGAKLVGLGGYTSVVTYGGSRVADRGVAITTGNSYTLMSAILAMDLACRRLGIALDAAEATVVGAGGAIGSGAIGQLYDRVGGLTLVGRPDRPEKTLRRFEAVLYRCLTRLFSKGPQGAGDLARRILAHPHAPATAGSEPTLRAFAARLLEENGARVPLRWSTDIASALHDAEAVVCATSTAETIILPRHLRPGAVVCDLSRPSNVSHLIANERPDVIVLDGGIINIPGRPDFGFDIGLPRGLGFACLAETMMLALDRRYEHTSLGSDLAWDTQAQLAELAVRHDFSLAGLRSFDQLLNDLDWQRVREQRGLLGAAPQQSARSTASERMVAEPNPGSVQPDELTNGAVLLLDRHLAVHGDKTAIVDGDVRYTYNDLFVWSLGMSRMLRVHGAQRGDTIAIVSPDSMASVALLLGAMRLGVTTALMNPDLRADVLLQQLQIARPVLVLAPAALLADVSATALCIGCPTVVLACSVAEADDGLAAIQLPADTPAVCLFTSGTTGQPKGVLHSHKDILNCNINYAQLIGIGVDDVVFSASKMFFAYGFNAVHFALFAGATAVLAPARTIPENLLDKMNAEGVTLFFSVPTIFLLMLDRQDHAVDLRALRLCVSAGEALPEAVYDAWSSRFGVSIIDGIGTTEALSTFITNPPSSIAPSMLTQVVPGFEVKLADERGTAAAPGEVANLWVKGNTVATDYLNDAVATATAFADGWFNTNDLFTCDEGGRFTHVGRAVEAFKVGGMWIIPSAIEAAVSSHQAVARCVMVKHVGMGKLLRPKVFIVPRPGVNTGPDLAGEIKNFVRNTLAPHQYPHIIEFVDELPTTATGKVQRYRLAARSDSPAAIHLDADVAPATRHGPAAPVIRAEMG